MRSTTKAARSVRSVYQPRITKIRRGRTVGLEVSPALRRLLAVMRLRAGADADERLIFRIGDTDEPYTKDLLKSSHRRLLQKPSPRRLGYSAPRFTWKLLRSTCDTYLVNAPGIFGTSSATFMASKQLGHSVTIAEKHYQNVHRGIPKDAHTLEAAMQIEDIMRQVIAASGPDAGGPVAQVG